MTPLYDAMLPPSLVRRLVDVWPDAKHVVIEYGERFPNDGVWDVARRDDLTIVTKDHDFADPHRHRGPPPQAVRLLIGNADPDELEAYLREHAGDIETLVASGERYAEV